MQATFGVTQTDGFAYDNVLAAGQLSATNEILIENFVVHEDSYSFQRHVGHSLGTELNFRPRCFSIARYRLTSYSCQWPLRPMSNLDKSPITAKNANIQLDNHNKIMSSLLPTHDAQIKLSTYENFPQQTIICLN